jgi:hypothetical protein
MLLQTIVLVFLALVLPPLAAAQSDPGPERVTLDPELREYMAPGQWAIDLR